MADIARNNAYKILLKLASSDGAHIEPTLTSFSQRAGLNERDRAFTSEIVYGVTRWRRGLDIIINDASKTPLKKFDTRILILLRMGLYQIFEMSRTPISAAVNETVNLAKKDGRTKRLSGFVNGVLRGAIRNADAEDQRRPIAKVVEVIIEKQKPTTNRLAKIFSFPDCMEEQWLKNYSVEQTAKIMEAQNSRAPVFFRLNTLKTGNAEFAGSMDKYSIAANPFPLVDNAYRLTSGRITPESEVYTSGLIQPQDGSSMIATSLLDVAPGDTVADICCGKGIKSGAFAQRMKNKGFLFCLDMSKTRLNSLEENMGRLGVDICHPLIADATLRWPTDTLFNKIFVDAPCSGTGTLRRHPEGKWNKTLELVDNMSVIQSKILRRAVERLAPGGELVYSVCSIEAEEGVMQIEKLLSERDDIARADLNDGGLLAQKYVDDNGDLFILPGDDDMDGFYAAKLVNKST